MCPDASSVTPGSSAHTDTDMASDMENWEPFLNGTTTADKTPVTLPWLNRHDEVWDSHRKLLSTIYFCVTD